MAPYGLARHNRNQMITPYRGGKCISGYWDIDIGALPFFITYLIEKRNILILPGCLGLTQLPGKYVCLPWRSQQLPYTLSGTGFQ